MLLVGRLDGCLHLRGVLLVRRLHGCLHLRGVLLVRRLQGCLHLRGDLLRQPCDIDGGLRRNFREPGVDRSQLSAQRLDGFTGAVLHFRDGLLVSRQAGGQAPFQLLNFGAQSAVGHPAAGWRRVGAAGGHRKELQLHDDLLHALPARRRRLRHAAGHQPVYRGTAGGRRDRVAQRQRELRLTGAIKSAPARQHFENQCAKRENVAARVGGLALRHFRSSVGRHGRRRTQRRDQIQTGRGQSDAGRRDRSMDLTRVVQFAERIRQTHGIVKRFRDGYAPLCHPLG